MSLCSPTLTRLLSGYAAMLLGLHTLTGCIDDPSSEIFNTLQDGGVQGSAHSIPAASPGENRIETTLIRIIDGDTVTVKNSSELPATNVAGSEHSVRLLGIDAPEFATGTAAAECGAEEASERLDDLISAGDRIVLVFDAEEPEFDRFGRSLAYLETPSGHDLGSILVEEGYVAAWYPMSADEPSRFVQYREAEEIADAEDRGSWAKCKSLGR